MRVGELIALVAEPGTDWKSVIIPPPEPTKNHSTTAILNPHKTATPSQKPKCIFFKIKNICLLIKL